MHKDVTYSSLLVLSIAMAFSFLTDDDKVGSTEVVRKKFEHNGITRDYIYFAPEHLTKNAPLLLVLHGFTSSAEKIMEYSNFNKLAMEGDFAVVYPQGTKDAQSNTFWNVGYDFHQDSKVNDIDFLVKLVDHLQKTHALSKTNTFATGMSNGGEMCYLLACHHPDVFSAVAPVAGTMMANRFEDCAPSRSIPVFSIFGTNDKITHYHGDEKNKDGWGAYKGIPTIIDFWKRKIGNSSAEIDTLPDIVVSDSSFVISQKYADKHSGVELLYYEIVGGGHDWPGAWGNEDIMATDEIWKFFKRFLR